MWLKSNVNEHMKSLFLIRHAKSSWDEQGLNDIERPLNDRGKKDAPEMAKRLNDKDIKALKADINFNVTLENQKLQLS